MSSRPRSAPAEEAWLVRRTRLPLVRRRCTSCSGSAFAATGKFRVNANGKLLDVWLLLRCLSCDQSAKAAVLERAPVRTIERSKLQGYQANDAEIVVQTLLDTAVGRRNRFTLDWTDSWELVTPGAGPPEARPVTVRVEFADPVPVQPTRLIARGLGISRREVQRRIAAREIVAHTPLVVSTAGFGFTVLPRNEIPR